MVRYALAIGIAQYNSLPKLIKPTADAEAVAQTLEQYGNFQEVKRLPAGWNTEKNCYEVADKSLSAEKLGEVLREFLLKQANKNEAVIYFSGHGITVSDNLGQQKVYLATSNCTIETVGKHGIALDSLNELIYQSQLSSLVVILDCCHAGYFVENNLLRQSLSVFSSQKDYYLITACRDFEQAYEGKEYSVFTEVLLEGLQPQNAGIDGEVSVDRLFDFIWRKLKLSGQEPIRMGAGRSISLVKYQLQDTIRIVEENGFNQWQDFLVKSPLELSNHQTISPRIIISPLVIDNSPNINKSLVDGLRQFLDKNYPLDSQTRGTKLLDGSREGNRWRGQASIDALFGMLKSTPTLVLESEVVDNYLDLRIAYWGSDKEKYLYKSIISGLAYQEILYFSAKKRALQWREQRKRLLEIGEKPEEINSNNEINLTLLEREERLQRADIKQQVNYNISSEDFQELCEFLISCYSLVTSWAVDAYYLTQSNINPLFPKILSTCIQSSITPHILQVVIQSIVSDYQDIYKILESDRLHLIIEIALQLAQSLIHLPDKSLARQQINYSIQAWLKEREVLIIEDLDLIDVLKSHISIEDKEYIEKIRDCLLKIQDEQAISKINNVINLLNEIKHREELARIAEQKSKLENVSLVKTLDGHSSCVHALTTSSNEQILISGSGDQTIKIWNWQTEELLYTYSSHPLHAISGNFQCLSPHWFSSVSISPDQKTIVAGSGDKTIIFLDLTTKKITRTLSEHSGIVRSIAISTDGNILASGSDDKTIKIWEFVTGKLLYTLSGHSERVWSITISPDGKTLASSSADNTVKLWNLEQGQLLHTLSGHSDSIGSLAITLNGEILASGSKDKTIKIWSLHTGELLQTLSGHSNWVSSIAISPNSQTLVSGSEDKTIKIWNIQTGHLLKTLTGITGSVRAIAISPDGQTIFSGNAGGKIQIWQVKLWEVSPETIIADISYLW
jgi:WD40 repeat protein